MVDNFGPFRVIPHIYGISWWGRFVSVIQVHSAPDLQILFFIVTTSVLVRTHKPRYSGTTNSMKCLLVESRWCWLAIMWEYCRVVVAEIHTLDSCSSISRVNRVSGRLWSLVCTCHWATGFWRENTDRQSYVSIDFALLLPIGNSLLDTPHIVSLE